MMKKGKGEIVPLKEAIEQVRIAMARLGLMHLAYSTTIVEELGKEKGKELILRSIMEYGRMVGERNKKGQQDLPFYGVHKAVYDDQTYLDSRKLPKPRDYSRYRVYDCILAKIFGEYGEKELGCLYCYVDPAKSMAQDPRTKLIHRACAACEDEYCSFDRVKATKKEKEDFLRKDKKWRSVDPILAAGAKWGSPPERSAEADEDP